MADLCVFAVSICPQDFLCPHHSKNGGRAYSVYHVCMYICMYVVHNFVIP